MATGSQHRSEFWVYDVVVYAVAAVGVGSGMYLWLREFFGVLPVGGRVVIPAVLVIGVVAPVVMGYSGRPFVAGVVSGGLPYFGLYAGYFFWYPTLRGLESSLSAGFNNAPVWLTLVGGAYVGGVVLRRDGTIHERNAELAGKMAALFVVAVALDASADVWLRTLNDQ
jgi:hypothetical protein